MSWGWRRQVWYRGWEIPELVVVVCTCIVDVQKWMELSRNKFVVICVAFSPVIGVFNAYSYKVQGIFDQFVITVICVVCRHIAYKVCELAADCAKSLLMLSTFSLIISTYKDYKIIFKTSLICCHCQYLHCRYAVAACICQRFAAECCNL